VYIVPFPGDRFPSPIQPWRRDHNPTRPFQPIPRIPDHEIDDKIRRAVQDALHRAEQDRASAASVPIQTSREPAAVDSNAPLLKGMLAKLQNIAATVESQASRLAEFNDRIHGATEVATAVASVSPTSSTAIELLAVIERLTAAHERIEEQLGRLNLLA